LIPSFVRVCDCAVIVYDVANAESLKHCEKWLSLISDGKDERNCSVVLVGNKVDLEGEKRVSGFDLAIKHGLEFMEVSAVTGKGIERLVECIVEGVEKFKNKSEKETR
jgi:small GTP-binding protein